MQIDIWLKMILELLFSSGRRPRCPGQRLRNHAL